MEQKIDSSDEQLVYMINLNNEDAKEILYKKYENLVHKELKSVKRSAYALGIEWQDLNQEALVGFANAISSYDERSDAKFSTYATLCVRRRLYNYVKKFTTGKSFAEKSAISIDDDRENIVTLKASTNSEPLNKILIDEWLVEVKKKINNDLTIEEQQIIDYAANGLKTEQIAKLTGKSSKQVYNTLYRVRKKLKS